MCTTAPPRSAPSWGISGPYFLVGKYTQPSPGTLEVRVGDLSVTVSGARYRAIATGQVNVNDLMAELGIGRRTDALSLYHLVRHIHKTGVVRALAFDMEFERVTQARQAARRP